MTFEIKARIWLVALYVILVGYVVGCVMIYVGDNKAHCIGLLIGGLLCVETITAIRKVKEEMAI